MSAPDASLLATKRIVYVGGVGDDIKEELIRAAFIPFGSIKSVSMVRMFCSVYSLCLVCIEKILKDVSH